MKYPSFVSAYHFFPWLQWAQAGFGTEKLWQDGHWLSAYTSARVCVKRRDMGVCKLTHFLNLTGSPKALRQLVTPTCSTTTLPPTLALPFLFLPDAKGRKRGHAIPHLLVCHGIPAPSAAGGQGQRGAQSRVRWTDSGNSIACYRNERTALGLALEMRRECAWKNYSVARQNWILAI